MLEKMPYGKKGLFWMMASDGIVHHGGKGAALGEMEQQLHCSEKGWQLLALTSVGQEAETIQETAAYKPHSLPISKGDHGY